MTHYIIADYAHHHDAWEFVSTVGDTPRDVWTTLMPYNCKEQKEPYKFENKEQAQHVLDMLKPARQRVWKDSEHFYRMHGRTKPQWKIYKIVDKGR